MAPTVISITNFKGRVGKTTLAVNLAACLAHEYDSKILFVDLDAQANASIWLLGESKWMEVCEKDDPRETSFGLFLKGVESHDPLQPYNHPAVPGSYLPKLWLLPSSEKVLRLQGMIHREKDRCLISQRYVRDSEYRVLLRSLKRFESAFEFVILDTPPDLYSVTCNAVFASDYLVVPCIPDQLSTSGLRFLVQELTQITKHAHHVPAVLGVAVTKRKPVRAHDVGEQIIDAAVADLQQDPKIRMVDTKTVIFRDYPLKELIVHSEAASAHKPLCLYKPHSDGYQDVQALTKAIKDAMERRS